MEENSGGNLCLNTINHKISLQIFPLPVMWNASHPMCLSVVDLQWKNRHFFYNYYLKNIFDTGSHWNYWSIWYDSLQGITVHCLVYFKKKTVESIFLRKFPVHLAVSQIKPTKLFVHMNKFRSKLWEQNLRSKKLLIRLMARKRETFPGLKQTARAPFPLAWFYSLCLCVCVCVCARLLYTSSPLLPTNTRRHAPSTQNCVNACK